MKHKIVCPKGSSKAHIRRFREQERERRKFSCEICSGPGFELHECIVTRRDAQGLPRVKRAGIFCNCNMILLCKSCHEKQHGLKDARAFWWEKMCEKYGYEEMLDWYASFEWKVPDRRFMKDG